MKSATGWSTALLLDTSRFTYTRFVESIKQEFTVIRFIRFCPVGFIRIEVYKKQPNRGN